MISVSREPFCSAYSRRIQFFAYLRIALGRLRKRPQWIPHILCDLINFLHAPGGWPGLMDNPVGLNVCSQSLASPLPIRKYCRMLSPCVQRLETWILPLCSLPLLYGLPNNFIASTGCQGCNFFRSCRCLLGQLSNLFSYDSESFSSFSSRRCFNGGIQGKQIRLVGNIWYYIIGWRN